MAKLNGHEELQALARIDNLPRSLLDQDPEVALAQTANLAALTVDWLGFKALVELPEHRHLVARHKPNGDETAEQYIQRVWSKLSHEDRGAALDLGLGKMTTLGKLARTGIQVRVWRAYDRDEWQHSPQCEDDFYAWVRLALTDSLDQDSESSKLSRLCEVVRCLLYNQIDGVELPEDVEDVFRSPLYWRFKLILPRLTGLVREKDLEEEPDSELDEQIAELVNAAKKPGEHKHRELEKLGRKKPPLPPIIFREEPGKDPDTGCYTVSADITEAQRTLLKQRMGDALEYRLVGEQYDTTDYVLVEYRIKGLEFCCKCGEEGTRDCNVCISCGASYGEFDTHHQYSKRVHEDDDWGEWQDLAEKPKPDGYFDSTHADPELRLEYTRFWGHAQ
jgi:hypothetical protein